MGLIFRKKDDSAMTPHLHPWTNITSTIMKVKRGDSCLLHYTGQDNIPSTYYAAVEWYSGKKRKQSSSPPSDAITHQNTHQFFTSQTNTKTANLNRPYTPSSQLLHIKKIPFQKGINMIKSKRYTPTKVPLRRG